MPNSIPLSQLIKESSSIPYTATENERHLSDEALRIADLAVRGILTVTLNGVHEIDLGRNPVNWKRNEQTQPIELKGKFHSLHVVPLLAIAYTHTGKAQYAEAAKDYLDSFMTDFPSILPGGCSSFYNVLGMGVRIGDWVRALPMLLDHPAFDEAFLSRSVEFLRGQTHYLEQHISTVINWRIFNARDLLTAALHLNFLPEAAAWKERAIDILNDAWFRQILPDHVHYECNPHYHGEMTKIFVQFYRLQQVHPSLGLKMTLDQLAGMYDFMLACTKPSGYNCSIHDSQSVFSGNIRDGIYKKGWGQAHKGIDYFSDWKAFRQEFGLPLNYPTIHQNFPNAGLLFSRTDWEEDASWISFDTTHWGGGHCHLSRNSIQLHANRRTLVVDPGWLAYDANEWGMAGKSTRIHNTCNLNGLNQQSTNPSRTDVFHAPGYDGAFSVYEGGYWNTDLAWSFSHARNGLWAQHSRTMFWVQDRFMFVADSMFRLPWTPGDPEHERPSFEMNWQLSDSATLECAADGSRVAAHWGKSNLMLLFPIRPNDSVLHVHRGEKNPIRGWLPGENEFIPAPQLRLNTPRMDKQHDYYVSILVPYTTEKPPQVEVQSKSPLGQIGFVKLKWTDGTSDEIHWGCGFNMMLGKVDDFSTDSSLVHLRRNTGGHVVKGCMVNGTYLKPYIKENLAQPGTIAF